MASLKELKEKGLWEGPDGYKSKIRYAYQLNDSQKFNGVLQKGHKFPDGTSNIYLGEAGVDFEPEIGRDKVREPDTGKLKVLESLDEIKAEYNKGYYRDRRKEKAAGKTAGIPVRVEQSKNILMLHPLNHDGQKEIFVPDSLAGYKVQISGAGPLGVSVAVQLAKLGISEDALEVYDMEEVDETETAAGIFRIFDPYRARATALKEIVLDQSMKKIKTVLGHINPDTDLGHVVVNTLLEQEVRKHVWAMVQKSEKTGLLLDAQLNGEQGTLYAINPRDKESVELYRNTLDREIKPVGSVIYMTQIMAGLVVCAIKRYIMSSASGRNTCVDRVYHVDLNTFFKKGGAWGQLSSEG